MPELPEVETVKRGIQPHITGQKIKQIYIYQTQLRWPIDKNLPDKINGYTIQEVTRKGKYILIKFKQGTLILHLGMTGILRILKQKTDRKKHDHVDIVLSNDILLRYNDTRRFGCILWTDHAIETHPLIKKLGPEPLSNHFNSEYLYKITRKRNTSIKTFIMNSHYVVGIGNIYANECLFMAGINPNRTVAKLTKRDCKKLIQSIKHIISKAIQAGGTTLKDFRHPDSKPGYFRQELQIYGRGGDKCRVCNTALIEIKLGQRQTVYCPKCQKN